MLCVVLLVGGAAAWRVWRSNLDDEGRLMTAWNDSRNWLAAQWEVVVGPVATNAVANPAKISSVTEVPPRPSPTVPPVRPTVTHSPSPRSTPPPPPPPTPAPPLVAGSTFQERLEAQVALARRAISPGSIDGVMGGQTRQALLAFQQQQGLPRSGELDRATRARLKLARPLYTTRRIAQRDLDRLHPVSPTWLGKSRQSALDYETLLELVAEESRSNPKLIRRLNPQIQWTNVLAGTAVRVPDTEPVSPKVPASFIRISLANRTLQVFDSRTNLLAHFPCSIGRVAAKRPVGRLQVKVCVPNPNYTFNPAIFPDSPEARNLGRKVVVPPGPNNPVGLAWIGLDRPSYGIHGTPVPEKVGRTESRGCFRLANWNATHLLKLTWVGMPVFVEP